MKTKEICKRGLLYHATNVLLMFHWMIGCLLIDILPNKQNCKSSKKMKSHMLAELNFSSFDHLTPTVSLFSSNYFYLLSPHVCLIYTFVEIYKGIHINIHIQTMISLALSSTLALHCLSQSRGMLPDSKVNKADKGSKCCAMNY